MARVLAVCISTRKGEKKHPVDAIALRLDHGIVGDAHAGNWHRQISLLANESVDKMREKGLTLEAGDFAENILTEGVALRTLPVGTRLRVGRRSWKSRRSARSATATARSRRRSASASCPPRACSPS